MSNALQRELDAFSREVMGGDFSIREVTKGAFTQARAKLDPEAFKELNEDIVANFTMGHPTRCGTRDGYWLHAAPGLFCRNIKA